MFRRTKIVATVGPASSSEAMLGRLMEAGVNVFRLNFSHGSAASHRETALHIRRQAERLQKAVAILADLQGPKIRIARFRDGSVVLETGQRFTLDTSLAGDAGDSHQVGLDYPQLAEDSRPGDMLLLDDGLIRLRVLEVDGPRIHCEVKAGGRLSDNKGINRKGGGLSARALTEKDRDDIVTAADMDVDYLALSFPRDASDVEEARTLFRAAGGAGGLVAKIERAEAVADDNTLDQIILASDGVMVARGDLAVEIGDAELVGVQKHIIQRARALDRFVITATQMMESMISSPQPTRAEVSDVANAVLDGTDAVMLSAETAVGEFPEETVRAMHRIIRGAERTYQSHPPSRQHEFFSQVDESIAMAAMYIANHLRGVRAIIAMTETGATPQLMSRIRSGMPIFAFTPHPRTQRRVAIYRGVETIPFDSASLSPDCVNHEAVNRLVQLGLVHKGDRLILTKGDYVRAHGGTNALKIVTVGEPIH